MTRFSTYAKNVKEALEARLVPVEGGPMDGVMVLTNRDLQEAIAATEIPPVDEHAAELVTPATVHLTAHCHICGEYALVMVGIESKTTVDDKRRIIAAKVDAGSAVHTCGQVAAFGPRNVTPEVEGQTEVDWTIPIADDAEPVGDDELLRMLRAHGIDIDSAAIAEWTDPMRHVARGWAVAYHVWTTHPGSAEPERPDHVPAPPAPETAMCVERGKKGQACLRAAGHDGRHRWGPVEESDDSGAQADPGTHSADGDPEGAGDPDDLLPE